MRAVVCRALGPVEALTVEEVPDPEPGPGEVLVDVAAAAVNFVDVLIVSGGYQRAAAVPFTPGSEFAGIVRAVGEGVEGASVRPGARVTASQFVGAFAERVAVPAAAVTVVPDAVDLFDAAAFGVAHATAYHALRSVAEVQPGEWVVVLGAAGGVGLAGVEVARHLGARVLAAASSAEKLAACLAKGAEAVVDYTTEDLKARIREITGGGADVVLDPVGGPFAEQAIRSTRWGGRFVCVGFASGEIPRIPLNLVLLKGVSLMGFEFWGFAMNAADRMARDREELNSLFASGALRPHISSVHPIDDVVEAMRAVRERRAIGKVLLDLRAPRPEGTSAPVG